MYDRIALVFATEHRFGDWETSSIFFFLEKSLFEKVSTVNRKIYRRKISFDAQD